MRKLMLVTAIAALAVGLGGPATAAGPPQQITLEDDVMFQSGRLTRACGFPVWVTVQGGLRVILHRDKDGVLHETDAFTDWSITFSAPSTGESFSYKFGPAFFTYPDGVYIGAPSIAKLVGLFRNIPGQPAEAGIVVVEAVVIAISPEGIPIVDTPGPVIFQHGRFLDPAAARAAICAALAG